MPRTCSSCFKHYHDVEIKKLDFKTGAGNKVKVEAVQNMSMNVKKVHVYAGNHFTSLQGKKYIHNQRLSTFQYIYDFLLFLISK